MFRKRILIVFALFFIGTTAKSQYGFGTNSPDANSVLHLYSQDSAKGLIIPVVTTTKRPAAGNSLQGMIVYNTTDSCMQFCNGVKWICLDSVGAGGGTSEWEVGSLHGDADNVIYAARAKNDSARNTRVYSNGDFDVDGHYMKDGDVILTDQPNNVVATSYNLALGDEVLTSVTSAGIRNVGIGFRTLLADSSGDNNVALGYYALYSNKTGSSNIGIGSQSLRNNTSGSNNVSVGGSALTTNTTGYNNTATGNFSMRRNTTGRNNVASGFNSLYNNTTGQSNVAVGSSAMYDNLTGQQNVAIGNNALANNITGSSNTGIGSSALILNTSGGNNTSIGSSSLQDNTTGSSNTVVGTNAAYRNTSGQSNTTIGAQSFFNNTTGNYNTSSGYNCLGLNVTGQNNTANGSTALYRNTSGNSNTGIGVSALYYNSTGDNNVALGYQSLEDNANTSNNVAIGYRAFNGFVNDVGATMNFNPADINISTENIYIVAHGYTIGETYRFRLTTTGTSPGGTVNNSMYYFTPTHVDSIQLIWNFTTQGTGAHSLIPSLTRNITNASALGANAQPTKSNQVTLGSSAVTEVRTFGSLIPGSDGVRNIGSGTERWNTLFATNAVINTSDKRLKTNINSLNYGLDELMKLQPVSYQWKNNENGIRLGFIAQDLQKLLPEVVNTANNEEKTLGVRYTEIIPVLTKAIQEQQEIIDSKDQELKELKAEMIELNKNKASTESVDALKAELEQIRVLLDKNQTSTK